MKVRATADGTYGGYYRKGPIVSDDGSFLGEVFEIDDKPYVVLDLDTGKPAFEKDVEGKVIVDPKTKKPKIKMASWFTSSWMEEVSDDVPYTAEIDPKFDYPPFQIPVQYREQKLYKGPVKKVPQPTPAAVI